MRPTVFQHAEIRDENDNIIQQGAYGKNSALSSSMNDGWIDYVMNNLEWLYDEAEEPSGVVTLTGDQTISDVKTFTSSPVAPTPSVNDDSTNVATTEFVKNVVEDYLPLSGGSITGDVDVTGAISGDSVTSNNVDVKSGSIAPVNTLQRSTAYSVDDIVYTSALNAKYYLLCVTAGTTDATLPSFSGAGSNTEITDGTVVWRVQTITSQEKAAGFPVGFEYFQMNPNVPDGSLPLLGGEYSRDTYADLWAWVQTQSGYLKTEAEWQTLSTANNGNVPFYSSGDGSTTFRVPSLHCWIKGSDGSAQLVGSYLEAGLPNITGSVGNIGSVEESHYGLSLEDTQFNGAFYSGDTTDWTNDFTISSVTPLNKKRVMEFNASRSSAIYGNSTTVQPESIVGMWLVKAYGVIVDTGQIDEQQYIDDRIAAEVTRADGKYLPLSGGTFSDGVVIGSSSTIRKNADNGSLSLYGGSVYNKGANILLNGQSKSNNPGEFYIYARTESNSKTLNGRPDGALTWDGVSLTDGTFLTVRYVNVPTNSNQQGYDITAPAVSGYQFVCWVMSATNGYVSGSYITPAQSSNAQVWITNPANNSVDCTALYVRKW